MSEYRKTWPGNLYFVTLTVVGWIDVFTRDIYKDVLIENLQYCQQNENLEIYAYVIMTNHLHMVARRDDEHYNLTELLGRFKSYTSKKLLKLIQENPQESRKEWLKYMFAYFSKINNQYSDYHFWQYANAPVELYSPEVIIQKVDYTHYNPVRAGIVITPEHYLYSSACLDNPLKTLRL